MSKHVTKHKSRRFRRFLRANEAVSILEYAMLVGVVAAVVGGAIIVFSGEIGDAIEDLQTQVATTTGNATTAATPGP